MKVRTSIFSCILSLLGSIAEADVELFLDSTQGFEGGLVQFDFSGGQPGSDARSFLSAWGVNFSSDAPPVIARRVRPVFSTLPPQIFTEQSVLINEGAGALVVDLPSGVHRAGLVLANGDPQTVARLQVFGPGGLKLAEENVGGFVAGGQRFIGFAGDPEELARVVIEYVAGGQNEEEIDLVLLEGLAPPAFSKWLPQFALAQLEDGSELTTEIRIANLGPPFAARVAVNFFDDEGDPMSVSIDGQRVTELVLADRLNAFESAVISPDRGQNVVGSARITSDRPLEVSALFELKQLSEGSNHGTGIAADVGGPMRVGSIVRDLSGRNTGIAIVNTSSDPAEVFLTVQLAGERPVSLDPIQLAPFGHRAFFIDEVWPEIGDFQGLASLQISSPEAIAATLIETRQGIIAASLPLGGPAKPMEFNGTPDG